MDAERVVTDSEDDDDGADAAGVLHFRAAASADWTAHAEQHSVSGGFRALYSGGADEHYARDGAAYRCAC
jgi:hypothetical protein